MSWYKETFTVWIKLSPSYLVPLDQSFILLPQRLDSSVQLCILLLLGLEIHRWRLAHREKGVIKAIKRASLPQQLTWITTPVEVVGWYNNIVGVKWLRWLDGQLLTEVKTVTFFHMFNKHCETATQETCLCSIFASMYQKYTQACCIHSPLKFFPFLFSPISKPVGLESSVRNSKCFGASAVARRP